MNDLSKQHRYLLAHIDEMGQCYSSNARMRADALLADKSEGERKELAFYVEVYVDFKGHNTASDFLLVSTEEGLREAVAHAFATEQRAAESRTIFFRYILVYRQPIEPDNPRTYWKTNREEVYYANAIWTVANEMSEKDLEPTSDYLAAKEAYAAR